MTCERIVARRATRRFWLGVIVALALSGASGCGSQTTFPVTGKVTHKDGTPVTAGLVIFEPGGQKTGARGEIKPDGTFQLGTKTDNDGAMEGDYKVLIAPPPLPEEGKRLRSPVAAKYQSLDSTPLQFTVTRDKSKNHFNITLD